MSPDPTTRTGPGQPRLLWAAGLAVATGAAVCTAHGLYQVAAAALVPVPIAWLYPLITDGLALVAYAATARLTGRSRRYAWTVVVAAAGLSGLAQASYLANAVASTPAALRFGVGAWPAIAAAIVAHLLHLIAAAGQPDTDRTVQPVQPMSVRGDAGPAVRPAVQPPRPLTEHSADTGQLQPSTPSAGRPSRTESPAADRARTEAQRYHTRTGQLPTVTQLMDLAQVSRGTAGHVLKELRKASSQLHIVRPQQPDARSER